MARRLFDFVEERRRAERPGGMDVSYSCGGFVGVRRDAVVRERGGCHPGANIGSLLCDGQVSACPSLPRDWAQGSALTTRFSEIWRTKFQKHRDLAWRREGPCADCSWFKVCLGGGLHERAVQPEESCWLDRVDG
ncbi:MAG TPA: SPASM domain-containing protein [Myxococcales bacterium]|jgi:radical SAM protein with 4Fe4S-binding SPASM domain